MPFLRGLEAHQEQDPSLLIRDTRTFAMRTRDFLGKPINCALSLLGGAAASLIFPGLSDVIFITGMGLLSYSLTRHHTLPFRLPLRSRIRDYNDPQPGSKKFNYARGICFYGNEKKTNAELWFSNEDMRTHSLIFGSTGSGKTETLISLGYNALIQGSGLIYVDGKGDNSLFAKIFSLARSMGREDDVLLINFMTGARDIIGPQENRLSNTMNPFANGSSSMLTQLVVSLMDSAGESSDGDMWKGRAISFVEALMKILVYMRDEGKILLDANSIRNYFSLTMLEPIVCDKIFPRIDLEPVSLADAPAIVLEPIKNYMINLPGYDFNKKGKQGSQTLEQHGFITMQLTRVFSSLADTYGHIIRTNLPEVDFKDVVLNRRILIVLLPALEKSPDELSNLGKVIIASLKAMMAAGLGDTVEGEYRDLIQRKVTNAPTPFMCILDEYGYYAVEGFAVVPAQARSLGFSAIFAGQDLPAFQKASKEEALSIGANTNIKICMKLEDPIETWDFFSKTAGEAFVTKVDSFQSNQQSVLNNYADTRSSSSERRARIDLLDLKEQGVGEMHVFFKSKIVRAKSFFVNPKPIKYMRLNHLLRIEKPDIKQMIVFENREASFYKAIHREDLLTKVQADALDVDFMRDAFAKFRDKNPIEQAVSALMAYHNKDKENPDIVPEFVVGVPVDSLQSMLDAAKVPEAPTIADVVTEEVAAGGDTHLTIFTKPSLLPVVKEVVGTQGIASYSEPLLARAIVAAKVELIERLSGRPEKQAVGIAKEIMQDIERATQYPPEITFAADPAELGKVAKQLAVYIEQKGREGGSQGAS